LRPDDNYKLDDETDPDSVYRGSSTSIEPFRIFVQVASSRRNLLPPWWNDTKKSECEVYGESGNWSDLRKKATKQSIMDHYGDQKMPMQLRMLGEVVYNRGPGGQDGMMMRTTMIMMESG
jgi:hypothetical protein